MKRVLAFLAAASALLMVSCTKELNKFDGNTGGLQKVSFKVSTEGAITKAVSFGSGNLAGAAETGELIVQAFVLGSDNKYTLMPNAKITISNPNAGKWDVDLQLAKGETYRIAFWAQKKETGIYNTDDLSAVTVDYSKVAINSDNADAFCATRELKVTGTLSEVVELKRPLAQINVGTNDRTVYNNSVPAAKQAVSGKVTLSEGVPSKINLIGATTAVEGVVAYTVTGETEDETVFGPTAANGADETFGEHNNLFMLYVLADPERQMMDFSVAIENAVNPMWKIDVSNLPFRANYRTNILGQLLTGDVHYDVQIVPLFNTPDYDKLVEPGFASVLALNTYLATMLDQTCEGDNGDIDPEVVILKADAVVGDEEEIILPKISGKIVFHILADCNKLTFKYADGAADAQKPAFVDLYLSKVQLLVINLDASHVECLAGDIVAAQVITGPDTFVIKQGAKVGKVEIEKGNAEVSGEVHQIEVIQGATADGEKPVEVFLHKESAVDQIVLNAATDVVVEQPKDNIEVGETEYKVEVLVNENGCTATAQNGGQIYVRVAAGVTCSVAADGESEAEAGQASVPSGVTIASVGDGSSVDTYEDEAGKIVVKDGVNEEQIKEKNFQAKIGDQHFMTVLEAYEAAKAGDTVVILVEDFDKIEAGSFAIDPSAALSVDYEAIYDSATQLWNVVLASWKGNIASDEQFAAATNGKEISISTPALLAKLAQNVTSGNDYAGYKITLTKDLDLNNEEWTPIGEKGKNFAGEFDGGGHTVSNLKITRGYKDIDLNWRVGFIGSAIGAKVHDLTIHNADVLARGEVAAAVGYNAYSVEGKPSEIYNVNVTGHVVISAAHRGAAAICGYSNYYVHECIVNVDETSIIDGYWASGGIVGFSPQSGDIKNNYSNIKVVSNYACGGIVGLIEDSVEISGNTVENTTLQASTNYGIGGLIGMMNYGTGLKIKNNTVSNVTIDATENVAGVIGAVWADYGTGAVEITNNTITGITINSSKGDGTAAFIGYIESDRTATISGNSIQGTINTAKALVNDGIWAGATDPSKVMVSDNTVNVTIQVVE